MSLNDRVGTRVSLASKLIVAHVFRKMKRKLHVKPKYPRAKLTSKVHSKPDYPEKWYTEESPVNNCRPISKVAPDEVAQVSKLC